MSHVHGVQDHPVPDHFARHLNPHRRVWLGDQCGHGCLQEVLDRRGNLAKAIGPLVRWAEQNQPTVDLNRVEYEKRERKRANLPL